MLSQCQRWYKGPTGLVWVGVTVMTKNRALDIF